MKNVIVNLKKKLNLLGVDRFTTFFNLMWRIL